jgi:hypothetical protein
VKHRNRVKHRADVFSKSRRLPWAGGERRLIATRIDVSAIRLLDSNLQVMITDNK